MRNLSDRLLYWAEEFFLRAHGWKRQRGGYWTPPEDYPGKMHLREHAHAVNSQRYYSRNPLMRMGRGS